MELDTLGSYRESKHLKQILALLGDNHSHLQLRAYDESHRFHHNWEHIESMLNSAAAKDILTDDLFLAIVFHDIVYDPKSQVNEENSAILFNKFFPNREDIVSAILETKTHIPTTDLSKQLSQLDLEILNGSLSQFMEFEHKIFKEFQFVDYGIYKPKRIEILTQLGVREEYIDYVRTRKPRIAIYAGSFNPFHNGHLNILKKAEKMFDKVIVARGKNPDKQQHSIAPLPKAIQYRETIEYGGLLTDLLNEYEDDCGPLTLIRGLRNGNDLSYEVDQYRYMQDLKRDIQVCSIFCDRDFEHISSSAIRSLEKFGGKHDYTVR